eukprot:6194395-Pleurochrysis_carterae.AAC.2
MVWFAIRGRSHAGTHMFRVETLACSNFTRVCLHLYGSSVQHHAVASTNARTSTHAVGAPEHASAHARVNTDKRTHVCVHSHLHASACRLSQTHAR